MNIGTKSVLFGAHQFLLHPLFVAAAWWQLYGFPWDPRLWVAFFVHDLGYLGKPNMDGPEGETHPRLGALIMGVLFDRRPARWRWHDFTLYHSRFMARRDGANTSRLCVADKLSTALVPCWLYLALTNLTGEIGEYMDLAHHREGARYATMGMKIDGSQREWFIGMADYLRRWAAEHRDGRPDGWTPSLNSINPQP